MVFYFVWTLFCGTPPFAKGVVPIGTVDTWDDFRSFTFGVAGIIGGAFGLYQLFNSAARTRLNHEDVIIKREAERNERFVKAAELLAHEDGSVRLAGVYALERLAKEDVVDDGTRNEGGRYLFAVVDVLAGFVRERTNRADYPPRPKREYYPFALPDTGDQDDDASEETLRRRAGGWGAPTEPVKAAIAALSNLCLQEHELSGSTIAVDLRGAQLPRLEAADYFLRKWRFDRANLACAFLGKSNCYGADFDRANLQQAVLTGSDIRHGTFDDADLSYSSLIQSKAERASFQKSTLYGARLDIANFQRARMVSAKMANVSLITTDLKGAFLNRADLPNAIFYGTSLSDTDLHEAKNLTAEQLVLSLWPEGAPPRLPDEIDEEDPRLDKGWCTNGDQPDELHPDIISDNFDGDLSSYRASKI